MDFQGKLGLIRNQSIRSQEIQNKRTQIWVLRQKSAARKCAAVKSEIQKLYIGVLGCLVKFLVIEFWFDLTYKCR
jgi:hypothetical protein